MRVIVLGAGGHGKVVADVVRACGHEIAGFVDRDESRVGDVAEPGGATILVDEATFLNDWLATPDFDAVAIAIGDNTARLAAWTALRQRIAAPAFVHPSAEVSPSVTIGEATIVMPRVVINASTTIGEAVILNSACIVEHDCVVGDGVHISPNATLSGGVQVDELAWIGAGATVIPCCTIGAKSIVGAGSTVIRDTRAGTTNIGSPTREVG